MSSPILNFFNLQRRIFGICPSCEEFFRLSDCKLYLKQMPVHDWMDKLDLESNRLDGVEERLDEKKQELQEKAREKGRRLAHLAIKKIDPIFTPRKLNPDDAKVLFHPIDYIVFNGMKKLDSIKNIVLLDRVTESSEHRRIQDSVEQVIGRGSYEWLTLRVLEDGTMKEQ